MICDYCHGKTRKRKVKKNHKFKGRHFIVKNVPAEVCQECGERYFHATTLDAIDRLNIGALPTIKLNWLQPHEGNIVDFLFRARAFQFDKDMLKV